MLPSDCIFCSPDAFQITETAETNIRKEHFGQEKHWKQTGRDTKAELKNVNVTESAEANIRKEQFEQEKNWKKDKTDTKSSLKVRLLFVVVGGDSSSLSITFSLVFLLSLPCISGRQHRQGFLQLRRT